jgi:hypothetical protein
MDTIESFSDLKRYMESHPAKICWYGPKSSDISGLKRILEISGIISCYGSNLFSNKPPFLVSDTEGRRLKCSVDNLAAIFIASGELLEFVRANDITTILPYDTNPELESFCTENNISLLSSPDALKDVLRDKTKIDEISRAIGLPTIPGVPGIIEDFEFQPLADQFGLPLFLHFAEGAGGSGNRIVRTEDEFESVKMEMKVKRLNVKKYFTGKSCSIDICVTPASVLCGVLEEMLIGAEPLNSNPTEYVASSWFQNNYSHEVRKRISEIGVALGELLRQQGFLGFFHPDFLVGENDEVFLTELNMRFGGSCGVYADIQVSKSQVPLMLAHALSFIDPNLKFDAEKINEQNLQPLDYGLIIFKNNSGKSIEVSAEYKPGLYKISDGKIKLEIEGAEFRDLADTDSFLLRGLPSSDKGSVIEVGAFICEVVTRFPISDSKSKLNPQGKLLAKQVFSQIIC